MVVTVRGCGKIVHAGGVGPPLMGRTDGALDIEALRGAKRVERFLIKAYYLESRTNLHVQYFFPGTP
eukprot:SAG11_NODE_8875_length_966_cov_5.349078_1_plen_67_part_00